VKHVLAERALELENAWAAVVGDDPLRKDAQAVFGGRNLTSLIPPATLDPTWDVGLRLSEFVTDHRSDLEALEARAGATLDNEMEDFGQATFVLLVKALSEWSDGEMGRLRGDLLRRYIGFPIWDAITYPIAVEHEVGERDGQIALYRVSPRETRLVQPVDPQKPKLSGMSTHHFGAFFARPGREKDYLWGRIDGCCQLIALLIDMLRDDGKASAIDGPALMRQACTAVLDEEWDHVPNARDLAEYMRSQITDPAPAT
jgi:hypothetical protein